MKQRASLQLVLGGLAVLGLVLFLSPKSSDRPDGLERVSRDLGLDATEADHVLDDGPLAEYSVSGVEDRDLARRLAGVIGVIVTFVIVTGLLSLARRSGRGDVP